MTKEQYQRYLQSSHWMLFRAEAIRGANRQCQGMHDTYPERLDKSYTVRCAARVGLQVHHKHYNTLGCESVSDVDVLCAECHKNKHFIACASCGCSMPIDFPHDFCIECWIEHNE